MTNVINFPVVPVVSDDHPDEGTIRTEKYGRIKYLCEGEMLQVLQKHPFYAYDMNNIDIDNVEWDRKEKQFIAEFEALLKRYYPYFTKNEFLDVYDDLREYYSGIYYP